MRQALSLLLAGVVAALLALVSPGAAQPASRQIRLTEKQVLGFIAAQPDMTALIRKTQGLAGDRPSQLQAELQTIAKRHGFKDLKEYDDVVANITMVMTGIDQQTKEFTEPGVVLKQEIEALSADNSVPDTEKVEFLEELKEALRAAVPVEFPGNIELVRKHYDRLDAALN
ncbi:MAG: hypothetical protein ACJ8F3_21285 [Xanthobacteraceae bacterium]